MHLVARCGSDGVVQLLLSFLEVEAREAQESLSKKKSACNLSMPWPTRALRRCAVSICERFGHHNYCVNLFGPTRQDLIHCKAHQVGRTTWSQQCYWRMCVRAWWHKRGCSVVLSFGGRCIIWWISLQHVRLNGPTLKASNGAQRRNGTSVSY